jgi:prophage regulatory protein
MLSPDEHGSVHPEPRILRRTDVENKTGLKRAYIRQLMREGKFPKSMRMGIQAGGWDAAEIDQWMAESLKQRD